MEYKTLADYLPSKKTIKKGITTGLVALALTCAAVSISGCSGNYHVNLVDDHYEGGGESGNGGGGPGGSI